MHCRKARAVTLVRFKQDVDALLKSRALTTKVRTRLDPRGLVISLGEGSCFDSGSDQLKAEGRDLLDALAPQLLARNSQVRIEGHTDHCADPNLALSLQLGTVHGASHARSTAILWNPSVLLRISFRHPVTRSIAQSLRMIRRMTGPATGASISLS